VNLSLHPLSLVHQESSSYIRLCTVENFLVDNILTVLMWLLARTDQYDRDTSEQSGGVVMLYI